MVHNQINTDRNRSYQGPLENVSMVKTANKNDDAKGEGMMRKKVDLHWANLHTACLMRKAQS